MTAYGLPMMASAMPTGQIGNPISRIARIFDPQLVKVEDRVTWLDEKLATFAQRCEYPLKVRIGYRGARGKLGDPDPSIILDLGKEFPLDSIFLIPAQREFLEDSGLFPKRFTLELSHRADFGQRTILFTSGSDTQLPPGSYPLSFHAKDTARFVKLTVQQGHDKEVADVFALSEFLVISDGEPVSFNAKVTTVGSLEVPEIWFPEALTDGRTPLGIWQSGRKSSPEPGDSVTVESQDETTIWTVSLNESSPLDRILLFPYQNPQSLETAILPEAFTISLASSDGDPGKTLCEWNNPLPGSSQLTPVVIPLSGQSGKILRLTATRPWMMGKQKIHALSEIEVWSRGKNIARGCNVTRLNQGKAENITTLTDGNSSVRKIIPISNWLQQLIERGRIERELGMLRTTHRQLASDSELNATWGSAVVLGLTFLIPVFMVERRRLTSKAQLDQIRKRIASDLHDDIGSNLGSISLIARTARKDLTRLHGPEEIAEDLDEMECIARESSLAMRDIVWLLERQQDSIGDLVQRMRETANRMLREIHFTLECGSNKTAAKLSLDAKRHLFLFYKEAVHNVFKHSRATKVTIRLWDENDKLALEINDNGIGIPNKNGASPVTVSKLEDRARVLDGSLRVESSKENGTRILLLVKRSQLSSHPVLS